MKRRPASPAPCPCDEQRRYADCCEPLHQGRVPAERADALMRSRYSAYALGLADYLLATWHSRTRPPALDLSPPQPHWLGLKLLGSDTAADGQTATVEFVARYRIGGASAQRMHERSRFEREDGAWRYVDGDVD